MRRPIPRPDPNTPEARAAIAQAQIDTLMARPGWPEAFQRVAETLANSKFDLTLADVVLPVTPTRWRPRAFKKGEKELLCRLINAYPIGHPARTPMSDLLHFSVGAYLESFVPCLTSYVDRSAREQERWQRERERREQECHERHQSLLAELAVVMDVWPEHIPAEFDAYLQAAARQGEGPDYIDALRREGVIKVMDCWSEFIGAPRPGLAAEVADAWRAQQGVSTP